MATNTICNNFTNEFFECELEWKIKKKKTHPLTERAPVMRALCVRVAGLRLWYPISGVPLLDGGFNIVSSEPLVGALIDALRVLTRGGVDS